MTDLILWRHGETDHNAAGRIQGRVDVPLNAVGLTQATQAARALAGLGPTRIVSSPLARARATAQALVDALEHDAAAASRQSEGPGRPEEGRRAPVPVVEVAAGLVERSFGAWEGLTRAQIEEGWPRAAQAWRAGEDPQGVGVETRAHAAARVGGAVEAVMACSAGPGGGPAPGAGTPPGPPAGEGPVVVVAHGSAITLAATHLLGADPSAWFGLRGLDNAHWAVLRRSARAPGWALVAWNVGTGQAGGTAQWTS